MKGKQPPSNVAYAYAISQTSRKPYARHFLFDKYAQIALIY